MVSASRLMLYTHSLLLLLRIGARQSNFQFERPFAKDVPEAYTPDLFGLGDNSVP